MQLAHWTQVGIGAVFAAAMAYAPYASPAVANVLHGIASVAMAIQVPLGITSVSSSTDANVRAAVAAGDVRPTNIVERTAALEVTKS
jgi:hypothetical protein